MMGARYPKRPLTATLLLGGALFAGLASAADGGTLVDVSALRTFLVRSKLDAACGLQADVLEAAAKDTAGKKILALSTVKGAPTELRASFETTAQAASSDCFQTDDATTICIGETTEEWTTPPDHHDPKYCSHPILSLVNDAGTVSLQVKIEGWSVAPNGAGYASCQDAYEKGAVIRTDAEISCAAAIGCDSAFPCNRLRSE